eukprot:7672945-Alexandrium_andersonii.AAC.1
MRRKAALPRYRSVRMHGCWGLTVLWCPRLFRSGQVALQSAREDWSLLRRQRWSPLSTLRL